MPHTSDRTTLCTEYMFFLWVALLCFNKTISGTLKILTHKASLPPPYLHQLDQRERLTALWIRIVNNMVIWVFTLMRSVSLQSGHSVSTQRQMWSSSYWFTNDVNLDPQRTPFLEVTGNLVFLLSSGALLWWIMYGASVMWTFVHWGPSWAC